MAFPGDYTLLRKIPIDATAVSGSNDDFTGLISESVFKLSKTFIFANTDNGGGDVRLSTDEAGLVQIPIEVVGWDTSGETCQLWYLADGVDDVSPTDLYIWGDNTGDSQPAVGAAFGRNAVWQGYTLSSHLESVTPIDSSGFSSSPLEDRNGVGLAPEIPDLGLGTEYFGNNEQNYGFTPSADTTTSMSAWTELNSTSGEWGRIYNKSSVYNFIIKFNTLYVEMPGVANVGAPGTVLNNNQLYYLTLNYDGINIEFYVDGVEIFSQENIGSISTIGNFFNIGSRNPGAESLDCKMYDITQSHSKTSGRIASEYSNQSDPASFYLEPIAPGGGITVTVTETLNSFADESLVDIDFNVSASITETLNSFNDNSVVSVVGTVVNVTASITELLSPFNDNSTINISVNVNTEVTEILNSFLDSSNVTISKDISISVTEVLNAFSDSSVIKFPTGWVDKPPTVTIYTDKLPVNTIWTDKG